MTSENNYGPDPTLIYDVKRLGRRLLRGDGDASGGEVVGAVDGTLELLHGPTLGPLTPKQVRILDNRHHRVGNTVRCACGYDIWAFCEVHRLIETIDAANKVAQPA